MDFPIFGTMVFLGCALWACGPTTQHSTVPQHFFMRQSVALSSLALAAAASLLGPAATAHAGPFSAPAWNRSQADFFTRTQQREQRRLKGRAEEARPALPLVTVPGSVAGLRAHRAYAASMRADPSCARFARPYPFHLPLGPTPGRDGDPVGASAAAVEAFAQRLFREAPPVVWMVQGGSGLGNGLWGFALAFVQSLLAGRALVIASTPARTLPSDFLCDAMECLYPRIDVLQAEKLKGTMISHGYQVPRCLAQLARLQRCARVCRSHGCTLCQL